MSLLRRPSKTPRLTKSRAQEASAMRDLGGRVTPGSGNRWHAKGDGKADRFLVEAKRTDAKQYTLKLDEVQKIQVEAMAEGREPVMHVQIGTMDVAVIPWYLFLQLTQHDKETT